MELKSLIENILLEGEIDNIVKNKKEKLSNREIGNLKDFSKSFDYYAKEFIKNVPTPKKYISKFFDLVEEYYMDLGIDTFESIYYYFNKWMLYKSQNLITKDILAQTADSLFKTVDEVEENKKRKELEKEIDKVYENDRWLVIRVKSKEASCKYGTETKWCISASKSDNRFTGYGYSENNFIYFVIDKKQKRDTEDTLYKMAILVNKYSKKIEVWDATDKQLSPDQVNIVNRFIPEIFEAIGKDSEIAKDDIDELFIRKTFEYHLLRYINDYKRTLLKYNTDFSVLLFSYELKNVNHYIQVDVDVKNNKITSTFFYRKLIDNKETGERYYDFTDTMLSANVINEKLNKSNFVKLIRKSVFDLLKSPEVKKYFIDNPKEYFSNVKLYKDIETMGTKKVPQEAFVTAIKLLKEKGEQNITTIRRIVDPRLLASHNVKPLLRSLYSFGLIKIEKRGRNVMIVPTPKLVKTPLNKLI